MDYSYNLINLPCDVLDDGAMALHYSYFADGTKYSVTDGDGCGRRYAGPFVHTLDEDGDSELESLAWDEGRIVYDAGARKYRDLWFVRDHVGNVRVEIREGDKYTTYNKAVYRIYFKHFEL